MRMFEKSHILREPGDKGPMDDFASRRITTGERRDKFRNPEICKMGGGRARGPRFAASSFCARLGVPLALFPLVSGHLQGNREN
jgi:hypothetical protein